MNSFVPNVLGSGRAPGGVEARRPLPDRTDAVLPIVGVAEVSARVTHDRDAKLLDEIEHVAAKPPLIGGGVARLVDAAIDAAPQMLDEGAKQAPVGAADGQVSIEVDFGLPHRAGSPCFKGSMQRGAVPCNGGNRHQSAR